MEHSYNGYPVFKSLQKPLEFLGIRGKFLIYAFASIGVGFVSFLVIGAVAGQMAGLLSMLGVAAAGLAFIYVKQKDGLHSKRKYKGVVVYKSLFVKEY